MNIEQARLATKVYRSNLEADKVRRQGLLEETEELERSVEASRAKLSMLEEEQIVIGKAGHDLLSQTAGVVAGFASVGVSNILGPQYHGVIISPNFDNPKSPKASLDLLKADESGVVHKISPYEDEGGGINDLIALGFQMGALTGYTPAVEGPFLMDEVAKHLSPDNTERLADHLKVIAEKSGRQIVYITHNPVLKQLLSDNVIDL